MTTLPFSVQLRKAETIEQFNKRVQKARADFIQQQRPVKQPAHEHVKKPSRRRPGRPSEHTDKLVITVRAAWLAGVRIKYIASWFGLKDVQVRALVHEWDTRPDCLPTVADIAAFMAWQDRLSAGERLDARMAHWINAVAAQARRNRPDAD